MKIITILLFIITTLTGINALENIINNQSLKQRILDAHNQYRRSLGCQDLVYNDNLASAAFLYGVTLYNYNIDNINSNKMIDLVHSLPKNRVNQGENLLYYKDKIKEPRDPYTMIVNQWILNEKVNFKYGKIPDTKINEFGIETGHYTQCINKRSKEIGCGLVYDGSLNLLVCRYSPPGNIWGQYPY